MGQARNDVVALYSTLQVDCYHLLAAQVYAFGYDGIAALGVAVENLHAVAYGVGGLVGVGVAGGAVVVSAAAGVDDDADAAFAALWFVALT